MPNYRKEIIGGVFWTGISALSERIIGIVTIAFLARLLEPKDFAVVAISNIVTNFVYHFTDIGYEAAIVQYKDDINKASNTIFYIMVPLCILVYIIIYILSGTIAIFYETEILSTIIKILAINIVIESLSKTQNILLSKDMKFREKAICEILPNVTYTVSSIVMASRGFGVWSIAYGLVLKNCVRTVALSVLSRWRPKLLFDISVAKNLLSYGKHVMIHNFLNFCAENIDNAMIGKIFGLAPLSFYKMSYNAANLTKQVSYQVLGRVVVPVIASLQDDKKKMVNVFMQFFRNSIWIVTPIFFILFFWADEFILLLYGPKWQQSILMFKILIAFGFLGTIRMFSTSLFVATGNPHYLPRLSFFRVLSIVTVVWFSRKYGLLMICYSIVLIEMILVIIQLWLQDKKYGIKISWWLKDILAPIICSTIMLPVMILFNNTDISTNFNKYIMIIVNTVSALSIYAITLLAVSKNARESLLAKLKKTKYTGVL